MPARVLIVDDHELVRKGVRRLFAKYDSFGSAAKPKMALRQFAWSQSFHLTL